MVETSCAARSPGTDVRTPWFVSMTAAPGRPPKMSKEEIRERKAFAERMALTPREDMCCADLNDDSTLKLLRLLRAYVDAGVSDAKSEGTAREESREHLRGHQRGKGIRPSAQTLAGVQDPAARLAERTVLDSVARLTRLGDARTAGATSG